MMLMEGTSTSAMAMTFKMLVKLFRDLRVLTAKYMPQTRNMTQTIRRRIQAASQAAHLSNPIRTGLYRRKRIRKIVRMTAAFLRFLRIAQESINNKMANPTAIAISIPISEGWTSPTLAE
jgi:hypothetical protein